MNNYILARWRDCIDDPPSCMWGGLVRKNGRGRFAYALHEIFEPGDQWLDITAIPAIPRAQVQAAVDNLVESSSYLRDCECPDCDAIRAMCRELGITPKERE